MLKEKQQEEKEKQEDNVIIIAGKGFELYNQAILNKLQKFDQIEICTLDYHLEKTVHIIRQWEAVGVRPKNNKMVFEKRLEDIESNENSDGRIKKYINRIILIKDPATFRFTKN